MSKTELMATQTLLLVFQVCVGAGVVMGHESMMKSTLTGFYADCLKQAHVHWVFTAYNLM